MKNRQSGREKRWGGSCIITAIIPGLHTVRTYSTVGVRRIPYTYHSNTVCPASHPPIFKVRIALFRNVTIAYLLYTDVLDYKPKKRQPTSIPGARDYLLT